MNQAVAGTGLTDGQRQDQMIFLAANIRRLERPADGPVYDKVSDVIDDSLALRRFFS